MAEIDVDKLHKQLSILNSANIGHDGKSKGYTKKNVVDNIRHLLVEERKY